MISRRGSRAIAVVIWQSLAIGFPRGAAGWPLQGTDRPGAGSGERPILGELLERSKMRFFCWRWRRPCFRIQRRQSLPPFSRTSVSESLGLRA